MRAGFPAAVLADFDFDGPDPVRRTARNRFRHTAEDRVERVSAESLGTSGSVVLGAVDRMAEGGAAGR